MSSKVRKNVTLSRTTIKQGKLIQEHDRRPSFSNTIEALIEREHQRLREKGMVVVGGGQGV